MEEAKAKSIAVALRAIVRLMVDKPNEVDVETAMNGPGITYRVKVAAEDCGKVIGKAGRTARSLRIIFAAISMSQGMQIHLNIEDRDQISVDEQEVA